jgi:hypothetical protein
MVGTTGSLVKYTGIIEDDDGNKVKGDVFGNYLGISYHGNHSDAISTRLMIVRQDTGKVIELYPTLVTFIQGSIINNQLEEDYDDFGEQG